MANRSLQAAKSAKDDEFYTRYVDIEREIKHYLAVDPYLFKGKTVYCNCDDPVESQFFQYFARNFRDYGLAALLCSSYAGSPIMGKELFPDQIAGLMGRNCEAYTVCVYDGDLKVGKDGMVGIDSALDALRHKKRLGVPCKADGVYAPGDFRSEQSRQNLMKVADIVVTNPPFSLFREYFSLLMESGKKFLIIGNKNAITYKDVFPYIKENKVWLGVTKPTEFDRPGVAPNQHSLLGLTNWFTNLPHDHRNDRLSCLTMQENLMRGKINGKVITYPRYDNYDAIEVPSSLAIPSDYEGVMGVPISFLDKYCPEQFEILGITENGKNQELHIPGFDKYDRPYVDGKRMYSRLLIKHKRGNKE